MPLDFSMGRINLWWHIFVPVLDFCCSKAGGFGNVFRRTGEVNVKLAESAFLSELRFNPEVSKQRREVTDKPCFLSCPEHLWVLSCCFVCLLSFYSKMEVVVWEMRHLNHLKGFFLNHITSHIWGWPPLSEFASQKRLATRRRHLAFLFPLVSVTCLSCCSIVFKDSSCRFWFTEVFMKSLKARGRNVQSSSGWYLGFKIWWSF